MPEYYRIDDKPVVMIWSPQNMNRDMGGKDGCRRLLELSRQANGGRGELQGHLLHRDEVAQALGRPTWCRG